MAKQKRFERMGTWEGKEGKFIQAFGALFGIIAVIAMSYSLILVSIAEVSLWVFLLGIATDLLVAFALTSFIMGILFTYHFREEGIVPIKEVLRTVLQVSLIVGLLFTLMVALDVLDVYESGLYDEDEGDQSGVGLAISLVLYFLLTFLGTATAVVVIMVAGFGMMGTLYMMEVGIMPKFLIKVQDVTAREGWQDKVMMWVFNIHGALDTGTVLVDEPSHETTFPWKRFRTAVLWQILFGFVVAIYISLNPWISADLDFDRLFRFVSAAIVVVPLLVLPWFIHMRLGSRIQGAHKDFFIYTAIRQRMTGLLMTAGTILIFLRLALERLSVEEIVAQFVRFSFLLVLLMIAFSFIYFNFIENKLAAEVYRRWTEALEEADGTDDEEGSLEVEDSDSE